MIKFETNEGISKIEIKGHISELCADVVTFLSAMYNSLKEDDEDAAGCFEHMLREHMIDMVFDDDRKSEIINLKKKEKAGKKEEQKKSADDDLIKSLESLIDILEKIQGNNED